MSMSRKHHLASHSATGEIPQLTFGSLEASNLRGHYEDVAANTLRSIVRHIGLIIALVVIALLSASLLVSQLPRRYTSEALVHPELFRREEGAKNTPLAIIDSASLVRSEARLIHSPAMVHRVVKQLGLDADPNFATPSSAFDQGLDWVRAALMPETFSMTSPLRRAAARVLGKLTVTNDTRSYLISVSFTAASPEMAANVANAFALEYLRTKTEQRLADAVTAASRELARQSAIYGERHPSISQAKMELESARLRLQAAVNGPEVAAPEIAPDDGITLAEPNPTPSSPKGLVILGLAFVSAVVSGMGLAVWLDRRKAGRHRRDDLLARTGSISS
jgi:uncharacterized protein involved in exopolysaccharide biosynthesis